jgi:hypothetical protein
MFEQEIGREVQGPNRALEGGLGLLVLPAAATVSLCREVHQAPHDHPAIFASAYKPPGAPCLFLSVHFIIFLFIITAIVNNVTFIVNIVVT